MAGGGESKEGWKPQLCILIVASSVSCLTTKISFLFWCDWLSLRDDMLNNMDLLPSSSFLICIVERDNDRVDVRIK